MLGKGDGTFQTAVNYTTGASPYAVAVGDFNGDGKLDLVTANYGANTASVLLGNGDGTFQAAVNYSVGTRASEGFAGAFGPPSMARGTTRDFPLPAGRCSIPSGASAYSVNITAIPQANLAYLTAWPTGQTRPLASTLNSWNGRVVANAAVLPAGAQGAISVFVTDNADVVIDINGYFVPAPDPAGLAFYPVTPCRVSDSRNGPPYFNADRTAQNIDVRGPACAVPAAARAYSLNVTAVPNKFLGFLTIWPAGQPQPLVSTLNSWNGQVVPNAAVVPAGANGAVSVYVSNAADVVIDINGYFAPAGSAGALDYFPVVPCRVADTRDSSGFSGDFGPPSIGAQDSRTIPVPDSRSCTIPRGALAYALNATAVPPAPVAFVTLWPAGQAKPWVSTLNSFDAQAVANMAIVPAGTNGAISVYGANLTDIVLDINGYFAPSQ